MSNLIQANAINTPLRSDLYHNIIGSPPYWGGVRQYSGNQHSGFPEMSFSPWPGLDPITVPSMGAQYGHESGEMAYVAHSVLILRELKRVLRPDGVLWWIIGDSLVGNGQLAGIPGMVMKAAQADGWIVRNELVWSKHNAPPEPLHHFRYEQTPCDCKRRKQDAAINEEVVRLGVQNNILGPGRHKAGLNTRHKNPEFREVDPDCPMCHGLGGVGEYKLKRGSWRHTRQHETVLMMVKKMGYYADYEAAKEKADTEPWRNPRSVLNINKSSYRGAHFAAFPPELVGTLLKTTAPVKVCAECGSPWARVFEYVGGGDKQWRSWRPTCDCDTDAPPVPGLVLDPFVGSGTTGVVCKEMGLRFAGLDLSYSYLAEQARWNIDRKAAPVDLSDLPIFGG